MEETEMLANKSLLALAAVLASIFGFVSDASAAKKLSYDQAYAKCKSIMDKEGTAGTTTQSNVRYTRGAACMKKYGYKL
jgi:hypothetical protein